MPAAPPQTPSLRNLTTSVDMTSSGSITVGALRRHRIYCRQDHAHSRSCRGYFSTLGTLIWAYHRLDEKRRIEEETDVNTRPKKAYMPTEETRNSFAYQVVVRLNHKARLSNAKCQDHIAPMYSVRTYKAISDFPRNMADLRNLTAASLEDLLWHLGEAIPKHFDRKRMALKKAVGWSQKRF